ncbi:MAG: hypothetical protein ACRDOJ_12395 [Nocardioidaceae bacterium]
MRQPSVAPVDPFELPDWLSQAQVLWHASDDTVELATVHGQLRPLHETDGLDGTGAKPIALDLLAVDAAWPAPVCDERSRRQAHQSWHYGEVVLLELDGRVTLGVPGTCFSADLVCEAVRRFTRAVGADSARFLVQLRL